MKVKRVTVAILAALVVLSASASSQAVNTRAIDSVRSKGVLSNQDLKVIDVFLAEAVQELVDTRNFTDIARLRTIILSRQGSQGQYARQFSESARKYIHSGLQRALTLEKDRTVKVTLNLLILIDGLSDMRLLDLSVSQLRSKNAVVRYWAVHSLTNPEIIKLLNSGGTATSQGAKFIAEKLMEIVNNSRPETMGLMAQFAAGVKIPQGEQLLLQIASVRIKQYAAWKVEYELLDGAILRLMAGKMSSTNLNRSNVAPLFGQLYSCVIQRYVRGKEHLSDVQKHHLASVIVGTEAGCTGKLLGTPQTAMKRAVERGDDSALWAEHNRLLGEGSKAGQLPTKLNFTYGTGPGGKKRLAPMALPAPPKPKAESSFNEATSQVTKRIAPVLRPKKQYPVVRPTYTEKRAIGISRDQVMQYLSNFLSIEKSTPVNGQERYMGQTSDNLAVLEIIGNKNNISQATIMIALPIDELDILARNTAMALRFLKNTVPEWTNSSEWVTDGIERLSEYPGRSEKIVRGNKLITMQLIKPFGMLTITVKYK